MFGISGLRFSTKSIEEPKIWLTSDNKLRIGWDNAPHHTKLPGFPHHKHIEQQNNIQSSAETCLEEVMNVILQK